ncbi:hypothetical protein GO988_05705 [Hymenobacter sp. HMF4947]|uniref:Uncharacterized protein n=1 Tax=Hymenobacter ginkgonis TaxID=2682976 RepID=A0A7K1TBN2_9BACT|nr:hypothetical protein [Hymenobacter ginkgonis]MVN75817.1 hypothetical protein [Hymenobacter ginkgonis]
MAGKKAAGKVMKYIIPIHFREDGYLTELIQQKFSTSLMSNCKWVKLIAALVGNWCEIKQCLVKPIWDEENPTRQLLIAKHTTYGFDYYASAIESMVLGNPRGWYAYKEIEWLDFPRLVILDEGAPPIVQDLVASKTIIDKAGQYTIELTQDNLRLYAYLK